VALMALEFQNALQVNIDHIIDGGLLTEGRIMACYVDYKASEYILGVGPAERHVSAFSAARSSSFGNFRANSRILG